MDLDMEDESRDFITIYKQQFRPKEIKKSKPYKYLPHYQPPLNILNGPYKNHLNTRQKNNTLPMDQQSEDPQNFLNRVREKYPHLKKSLPESLPNEDLIELNEKKSSKTVYQEDYSIHQDDYLSIHAQKPSTSKIHIVLPENWYIPETVQKQSYRDPWKISSAKLLQTKPLSKPQNNLDPCLKEREILCTRTGDSEYNATIGHTGDFIIKEQLFGTPLPVEPSIRVKDSDNKSECSFVLVSKKLALPSNIF